MSRDSDVDNYLEDNPGHCFTTELGPFSRQFGRSNADSGGESSDDQDEDGQFVIYEGGVNNDEDYNDDEEINMNYQPQDIPTPNVSAESTGILNNELVPIHQEAAKYSESSQLNSYKNWAGGQSQENLRFCNDQTSNSPSAALSDNDDFYDDDSDDTKDNLLKNQAPYEAYNEENSNTQVAQRFLPPSSASSKKPLAGDPCGIYKCIYCCLLIDRYDNLVRHTQTYHPMAEKCNDCSIYFLTPPDLLDHKCLQAKGYRFQNREVLFGTDVKEESYDENTMSSSGEDPRCREVSRFVNNPPEQPCPFVEPLFECPYCRTFYKHQQLFHQHIEEAHPRAPVCKTCRIFFYIWTQLGVHIALRNCVDVPEIPNETVKRENIYEYVEPTYENINDAKLTEPPVQVFQQGTKKRSKRYQCNMCRSSFQTLGGIKRHSVKMHSNTHKCVDCSLSFQSYEVLLAHISKGECVKRPLASAPKEEFLETSDTKRFMCIYCNTSSSKLKNLRMHVAKHHPNAIECKFCQLFFHTTSDLTAHDCTHYDYVKCDFCDKYFSCERYKLAHHRRIHSEYRLANNFVDKELASNSQEAQIGQEVAKEGNNDSQGSDQRDVSMSPFRNCQFCGDFVQSNLLAIHLSAQTCNLCKMMCPCANILNYHTCLSSYKPSVQRPAFPSVSSSQMDQTFCMKYKDS